MARFLWAAVGTVMSTICATGPEAARAGTPDGADGAFCLTGVQRYFQVAPDLS
jgi:hypothetical protein